MKQKPQKNKELTLKNVNKIDKPLKTLTKKRENTQFTNIRMKQGTIITGSADIKIIKI